MATPTRPGPRSTTSTGTRTSNPARSPRRPAPPPKFRRRRSTEEERNHEKALDRNRARRRAGRRLPCRGAGRPAQAAGEIRCGKSRRGRKGGGGESQGRRDAEQGLRQGRRQLQEKQGHGGRQGDRK